MRQSGVLLHISSLSSPYGIGTLGKEAYEFVDFLQSAGQRWWQMLPIGPTGYGDSPYQSLSAFAGNPYFIDLRILEQQGLLQKSEFDQIHWGAEGAVDFGALFEYRLNVLRCAQDRFFKDPPTDFDEFCRIHSDWLEPYAEFMTLKEKFGGGREDWAPSFRRRETAPPIESSDFYKMLQYLFFEQWQALKSYAHQKGIYLLGDIPIYVASDSSDVWDYPDGLQLDAEGRPVAVAGCPPDKFSPDGQLWGNPLYDWAKMEADGFYWWKRRMEHSLTLFDKIRIDHFRGFEGYYQIPAGQTTAKHGSWKQGPGLRLFQALGVSPDAVIAEDLGFITPEVRELLRQTGFCGTKVLQFAFDGQPDHLPYRYPNHCAVYTGTHDNDTILGWLFHAPMEEAKRAIRFMRLNPIEGMHWGMMSTALASAGDLVILTAQDLLGLDSSARMNTPGTTGNWRWRVPGGALDDALAHRLYNITELYGRI